MKVATARVLVGLSLAFAFLLGGPVAEATPGAGEADDPLVGVRELIASGKTADARSRLVKALDIYRRRADRSGEGVCDFFLGLVESVEGDLDAASASLERSAATFEANGDGFGAWAVVQSLAALHQNRGDLEVALALHRRGLSILQAAKSSQTTFSLESFKHIGEILGLEIGPMSVVIAHPKPFKFFLLLLAEVMSRLSHGELLLTAERLEEAESELLRADEISRLFNGALEAPLSARLGDLRRRQWRLDDARQSYQTALEALPTSPPNVRQNAKLELQILGQLEEVELLSGQVDKSLAWNERALSHVRRLGDRVQEANVLQHRGRTLMDGHRFRAAEATLNEALGLAQKARHGLLSGLIHNDLATLALHEKKFEQAAVHAEHGVRLFQTEGVPFAEAVSWTLLAEAYLSLDSLGIAAASLNTAASLAERSGHRETQDIAELLAEIIRFRRSPTSASAIERLITSFEESPRGEKISWEDVKMCYRAVESLAANGAPLPPSLRPSEVGSLGPPGFGRFVAGLSHYLRGETAEARALWLEALAESPTKEREVSILTAIGASLWRDGKIDEAIPYYAKAVDAIEAVTEDLNVEDLVAAYLGGHPQSTYHVLINMLVSQGRLEEAFNYTERARARAYLQLLGGRHIAPRHGADAQLGAQADILRSKILEWERQLRFSRPQVRQLSSDLQQGRQLYQSLLTRLKVTNQKYSVRTKVAPLKLEEVRNELGPETTLIGYFVSSDLTHAWVVDQDGFQQVVLPVEPEDYHLVTCWANALGHGGDRGAQRIETECEAKASEGKELYSKLIAPLAPYIRHRRLLLVPHGVLHYLPFAALQNPKTGRHLIDDFTLTYAPSASVLPLLRAKESLVNGQALVLGAPDTTGPPLESLPAAQDEAKAVAHLFGSRPLLGAAATEGRLYDLEGKVDLLHIAAHGLYESGNPLFSRIALAPDREHDGNLEVHEVLADLDLTGVNLVVLSACETARGERSGGDEITGLTRAFLYAGAPAVISTLWKIDDAASAILIEDFYRRLLDGVPTAEALQQAQLGLRRRAEYQKPYYWAAFSLTGNPQSRWRNSP